MGSHPGDPMALAKLGKGEENTTSASLEGGGPYKPTHPPWRTMLGALEEPPAHPTAWQEACWWTKILIGTVL